MKRLDMVGKTFGRLFVVRLADKRKGKRYLFCRCECGKEKEVALGHLHAGRIQSCGCLQKERASEVKKKHGLSHKREYHTWFNMMLRCYKPSCRTYPRYGGRGIKVCRRWKRLENFVADMGAHRLGYSIDRIDPDGDYEPGNCRWVNRTVQNRNRSFKRLIECRGRSLMICQWAEERGISKNTIESRLRYGWPIEQVLGFQDRKGV